MFKLPYSISESSLKIFITFFIYINIYNNNSGEKMKTLNERISEKFSELKEYIIYLYEYRDFDISKFGKYLLKKYYRLSLFDNSNLITKVNAKQVKIPGTDSYNFNNADYYKYNYDSYNYRHPMNLRDVLMLIDKIYKIYGAESIPELYKLIEKNME